MRNSFWNYVIASFGGAATVLGVFVGGYQFGESSAEKNTEALVAAAQQVGAETERKKFEDAEYRDKTLASLLAIVASPEVKSSLTEEENTAIEKAQESVAVGDYKSAVEALPSGVIGLLRRDCIDEGTSVLIEEGTAITACHYYGTTALIGEFSESTQKVKVTIDGETQLVGAGESFSPNGGLAVCAILIERTEKTQTGRHIRVSFSC